MLFFSTFGLIFSSIKLVIFVVMFAVNVLLCYLIAIAILGLFAAAA